MKKKGFPWRLALLAVIVIAVCVGAALLVKSGMLDEFGSVEGVRARIDAAGPMAGLMYFLLQMMTVIVAPIPSNVTMMAGAMALGFWEALILGLAAVVLGSVLMFAAGRVLGREALAKKLSGGVMEKYLPVIEEKQDMFLLLTMLFPFFPDDIICILAGLTSMSFRRFAVIMAVSRPWGLVISALLGSGLVHAPQILDVLPWWVIALAVAALTAVFILALRYAAEIEAKTKALVNRLVDKMPVRKK